MAEPTPSSNDDSQAALSGAPIWIGSEDGRARWTSPAFRHWTGQTPAQAQGLGWLDAVYAEDRTAALTALAQSAPGQVEIRLSGGEDAPRWVVAQTYPHPEGRLMLLVDHTAQRQARQALENELEQYRQRYEHAVRQSEELGTLAELSADLRKAPDHASLLPRLLEQAVQIFGADTGALIVLEDQQLVFSAVLGAVESLRGVRFDRGKDRLWELLRGTQPLFLSHRDEALLSQWHIGRLMLGSSLSAIITPLRVEDNPVGLLYLGYNQPSPRLAEQRQLLAAFSEIAASALYRTQITERLAVLAGDRGRELATVYRITAVIHEAPDLAHALSQVLSITLAAVGSKRGGIHLVDEPNRQLLLAVEQRLPPAVANRLRRLRFGEGVEGWIAERRETVVSTDLSAHPSALPGFAAEEEFTAYVGAPMRAGGRVLGVLFALRSGQQPFSADEVALLSSIADHLGLAVENAALQQRAGEAAVLEERHRLARELHDSVTQSLYSVTLFAEAAQHKAAEGSLGAAQSLLVRVGEVAHQALKEMRMLLFELRSPALDQDGLAGALQQRLDSVETRVGIQSTLQIAPNLDLPLDLEQDLYRIAIEALNNTLKHARASEVIVALRQAGSALELEIRDNGIGFQPGEGRTAGMGLVGMRERAHGLGGSLDIESAPGRGARVIARIPAVRRPESPPNPGEDQD